MNVNFKV